MKNDALPLLDFDGTEEAISPSFEKLPLKLPRTACFAFLSERRIRNFAEAHQGIAAGTFVSLTKSLPVFILPYKGKQVALMQAPVGAPAAVIMEERLFAYGVEKLEAIGSCGVLKPVPENIFLIVDEAVRDEGTSYHYVPPAPVIRLDKEPVETAEDVLADYNLSFEVGVTWTNDGFFRETKEKIRRYRKDGVTAVDMECAALAACARFRHRTFGQVLFTADTLAEEDAYDERSWGRDSRTAALEIGLEIAYRLDR